VVPWLPVDQAGGGKRVNPLFLNWKRNRSPGGRSIEEIAVRRKPDMPTPTLRWPTWMAHPTRPRTAASELPLRAELFNREQLERHARSLAASHRLVARRGSNRLLQRLDQNEKILRAFNHATLAVDASRRVTPAAEWLLDNFYLIEEQIQMARRHLPRGYNRELPRLAAGESAGFPRAYDLVLELIAHVDAQIDAEPLAAFFTAYQAASPLKLGELWAIPIMLRLGLIENLQRVTTRLAAARLDRNLADLWVDRLREMAERDLSHLVIVVADMARADLPLTSSFVAEFSQRLARHSPVLHVARDWIEQRLAAQGRSIEELVHQESQSQAADQVSVSHSIASLRFLSAMNWKDFVESLSEVERELRTDPAAVYPAMDFPTRDRYRHVVEAVARHGALPEAEVARQAVRLAQAGAEKNGRHDRTAHVGYYLVDQGLPLLARAAHARWPWRTAIERGIHRFPLTFYVGGVSLLTAIATAVFAAGGAVQGVRGGELAAFTLIFLVCASQLSVALMNWFSMLLVQPRLLPRLDFSGGIPPDCRTMVVVPTLLTSLAGVDQLIETLEIHYLANRDAQLHFALLTDFRDAPAATTPEDAPLLAQAEQGIALLNQKYPGERPDRFFLFHRPRRWNAAQGVWMGYERKRGKLAEFNALLRGGPRTPFSRIVGDEAVLSTVKYVITLDTDTQLPHGAARQLVGTMAHPLNRPQFDPARGVVSEGYGILQPRMGVTLPSAGRSWFVRLFAGEAGIDPYTRAVSDVYQDIFQEGSFIGKGIYDVEAFERAMAGRFPENTVLSHDLLEACHARSALVSDVEFYEDHPSRYNVDIGRRHRWIRGDWQITQWLLPRVPGPDARRVANPLSGLSQWKIFDNLRRSLVPAALLLLLLGSWLLLPERGALGSLLVLLLLALPGLAPALVELGRKPNDRTWRLHWSEVARGEGRQLAQVVITLAFLPYDAFVSLDAIGRTLLRVLITHRRLLEWQTSSDTEKMARADLPNFYATMWIAPAAAGATGALLLYRGSPQFWFALPILAFWCGAPAVAWWISRPIAAPRAVVSSAQRAFLRQTARRTWHFFETFVTAEENWLPPDNFQEVPAPLIASRTSPTNLGLAVLANLAARDFGYISAGEVVSRLENTFATLGRLERYRGHFYNWYDTRTLQPLMPLYVSSVDSGNLAGHLLTLGAGLRELPDEKIFTAEVFAGLRDTIGVLRSFAGDHPALAQLDADLTPPADSLPAAYARLTRAAAQAAPIAAALASKSEDLKRWSEILRKSCEDHADELRQLCPWLAGGTGAPAEADRVPTLRELADADLAPESTGTAAGARREGTDLARQRLQVIERLAAQSDAFAVMDFTFLSDPKRDLFSIGYNVSERRLDASFYDLLASESRMGTYVAIAQAQVPQDYWFALGRLLVSAGRESVLVSWSGSMFEYLMPMLVMPSYEHTLLDQSCRAAVHRQIDYARPRGVPWGISESGYNRTDARQNYQYRAFGVPGLGLKRGLAEDLVIAPYASVMALMVAPKEACENLQRLAAEQQEGAYGFYEAVDYTSSRLPPNEPSVTVRSFMVHHEGMSFLALDYFLQDRPMQRRFMACPELRAAELLLQERVPKATTHLFPGEVESKESRAPGAEAGGTMRVFNQPSSRAPQVHLLSNGRYHVAITQAGGGYSRWRDVAITRWREDATRDCWGQFLYLRDATTNEFWSAAYQPTLRATKTYEAIFTQARAEFRQQHLNLEIHTEISVSPEDDVELRRLTITNHSSIPRAIEITSYAEVVLAPAAADDAHPAFSNLFVQTEFLPAAAAVLCTRRARAPEEKPPWLLHLVTGPAGDPGAVSCETDRARFIGRGGSAVNPAAMRAGGPLSNTAGSVLDPVVALRRAITLEPNSSATVVFVLGAADTREAALALVDKYQAPRMADRAFDLAWTHAQVLLRQLDATEASAQLFGRLAGALIYADRARRAAAGILLANRRGQSGLWSYGVSGDSPIALVRVGHAVDLELVQQLIQAHAYWRLKGLVVELVILNEDVSNYRQSLHDQITQLIVSGIEAQTLDKPGGIFVRRLEQIPPDDRVLLQSAARVVLDDGRGALAEQLESAELLEPVIPALAVSRALGITPPPPLPPRDLIFRNGFGGFTPDGQEYVITLEPGQMTPAPWVNVIANPNFGTVVSESGSAYTWAENSHEFRLTPWSNDPVQDTPGEALYLRDEQTGQYWSPTPLPVLSAAPYVIRHGFGYSVFEHAEHGIASEVWVYVAMDAPVKFVTVKLRNVSGRPRRLSVTGYWEWVLGDLRPKSLLHVQTEVDVKTGAVLARNYFNAEFSDRIAFLDVSDAGRTLTGDRQEFLGRNGTPAHPAAMSRMRLSGRVGAGLDPCAALQLAFDLPDGQEKEISFRLGAGRNLAEVQNLIQRFRRSDASQAALEGVWAYWKHTLGRVHVETPDPGVNCLANGWLLYQTLSCRVWGRTGFYQSGGAYGFRDQLQDVMALVHAEPALTREQLLRSAARQFREGDVQHWWHPPAGRGVRTHCSDDYLWLPYVTCRYVSALADTGILEESVPFLEGRAVKPDEEGYYDLPLRSPESATLYDHCVRAIEHGLRFGAHGLPLMGCGDWNDGMNLVGKEGRGESVWLAFFLYDVLLRFADIARGRQDAAFAERCLAQARQLQKNIETHTWDGAWYRRAYFDNGAPLGSHTNVECQIDSLPQSWSVISGAGDPVRAAQAMQSVQDRLVHGDRGLIQLFDPPFDLAPLNPGYIKGYIPGVRENGGQYTHGAVWTVTAFALRGETERAWALFNLLNPILRGGSPERIAISKVEPYVLAGDVYAVPPHTGRGGWSWYTGSAGWMYRLLTETLLGLNLEGTRLRLEPRMPNAWTDYKIHYRYRETLYHIVVTRRGTAPALSLDGQLQSALSIPLMDDQRDHRVELTIP
jgi:cyclic beta-1,2-glucan synthetase